MNLEFDPAGVRLGRPTHLVKRDRRTLPFARYLRDDNLPTAPSKCDYGNKVARWGMFKNDELGDCTVAGILHMIKIWSSQNGIDLEFTDDQAIALYMLLCGYVPGHPETDQGGVELDILKAWRKIPILGHQLDGFVSIDPKNWEHIKLAHYLFGTLYFGIDLPLSAQEEKIWSATRDHPGGWGGHCVVSTGYRDGDSCLKPGLIYFSTWGAIQPATKHWVAKYCDEIYAPLSPTWRGPNGKAPNGFDYELLAQDQARLAA